VQEFYFKNLDILFAFLVQGARALIKQSLLIFSDMKLHELVCYYPLFVAIVIVCLTLFLFQILFKEEVLSSWL
jgi:hypothetical protein